MREKQVSTTELAKAIVAAEGTTPDLESTKEMVRRYRKGQAMPETERMRLIGEHLGGAITVAPYLQFGIRSTVNIHSSPHAAGAGNVREMPPAYGKVPLVSWVSAGPFGEAVDPWTAGDGMEYVETEIAVHQQMVGLVVEGNSMENPKGEPSFPDGCTIIVDGAREPKPGDFVVVRAPDWDEASFKQYRVDGGRRLLVPLNPQYPTMVMSEDIHLVGVVVEMIPKRRRFY